MSSEPTSDDARRQRLDEVVGEFLVAHDAGQRPDPREWLARHAELCPELAEFFTDRERMEQVIDPLRVQARRRSDDLAAFTKTAQTGSVGASPPSSPAMSELAEGNASLDTDGGGSLSLGRGTLVRYFGDYELIKELGRGGMGVVYKARQISLNRPVALKMIRSAALASDDELRRFQNEAEAVALLDHPHIVPVLEVGNHDGQRYFSMKLIGGMSLEKVLADYVVNPKAAARLAKKAAEAVHHAHQRGILHRDLKPANILLDEHREPYVTDFGLAKRVEGDSELTHSGAILGTPAYMAPEQASGRRGSVTTASDVYGLGAVLYALLTGRAPFAGESVGGTLEQVRESTPPAPSLMNRRAPRDLEVICLKCLEKEPSRRYASAQALSDDLGRYIAGEPIAARPTGMLERGWLWCRRNPWLAAATGATAAALVAVAVFAVLYARQQSRVAAREKQVAAEKGKAKDEIAGLAKDLKSERDKLRTSLADSNHRLAMLSFERAQRSFHSGQPNYGLLYLVETWHYALEANDPTWQRLARANLSLWRYSCPEVSAVFPGFVSISPDGKTILSRGDGKNGQLWDVATGRPIGQAMVHAGKIRKGVFSPDSTIVATSGDDSNVRLWNAKSGHPIGMPLQHQDLDKVLTFNPKGGVVLTGSRDGAIRLWSTATASPIGEPMIHQSEVSSVEFSADGRVVVTNVNGSPPRLWDAPSGRPIANPIDHETAGYGVRLSPDGKTMLIWDRYGTGRLWNFATGLPAGPPMAHEDMIVSAAFSPDGKTVVTGWPDLSAQLWNVVDGRPIGPPLEREGIRSPGTITHVSFSPDGSTFLVYGLGEDKVRLGDPATGLPIGKPLEHRGAGEGLSVAFSQDGKTIATSGDDSTTRLWDAASGLPIGQPMALQGEVVAVVATPEGTAVLTVTNELARLWTGVIGLPVGQPLDLLDRAERVWFSRDGKTLRTTGSHVSSNRLWDATTGLAVREPLGHDPKGGGMFNFEDDNVAAGDMNRNRTTPLWNPPQTQVWSAAISPDGKTVLVGSADGTARLWDAATRQPIGPALQHQGRVEHVAFSPDGRTLATASNHLTEMLSTQNVESAARLWHLPALLDDDLPRVKLWVESMTGLAMNDDGSITRFEAFDWQERCERLRRLGGPPKTDDRWLADPILYGPDPTARARAWIERKCWEEAEAAFSAVVRARPLRSSTWKERGRFHVMRAELENAAADFAQALALWDRDPNLLDDIVASNEVLDLVLPLIKEDVNKLLPQLLFLRADRLVREGRFELARAVLMRASALPWEGTELGLERGEMFALLGCSDVVAALVRKHEHTINLGMARQVAWCYALCPFAVPDPTTPVSLAEFYVNGVRARVKPAVLNAIGPVLYRTLGAVLYRAGRFEDAVQRLREGIRLGNRRGEALDWAFLAMAHQKLGHRDEARRWLDRLHGHEANTDSRQFWDEMAIHTLRREAEAVVLYDPVFPANPFAP
jgi:eukaryotic-like serine/threonine-protein kinase